MICLKKSPVIASYAIYLLLRICKTTSSQEIHHYCNTYVDIGTIIISSATLSKMKSFTTALSAIMCICAAQSAWGYDLFLEDTMTETEQATPSPSPISTEWSTVEETDETTVVSTDSSSIMPSDDKCDVSESADGVRMLRGSSLSQEETERIMTAAYLGVNGKRRLQNTGIKHACMVKGKNIGDRCLVITDIKFIMTVWYSNPDSGKKEIGR